jgi:ribosome maturation protein Sdo1
MTKPKKATKPKTAPAKAPYKPTYNDLLETIAKIHKERDKWIRQAKARNTLIGRLFDERDRLAEEVKRFEVACQEAIAERDAWVKTAGIFEGERDEAYERCSRQEYLLAKRDQADDRLLADAEEECRKKHAGWDSLIAQAGHLRDGRQRLIKAVMPLIQHAIDHPMRSEIPLREAMRAVEECGATVKPEKPPEPASFGPTVVLVRMEGGK